MRDHDLVDDHLVAIDGDGKSRRLLGVEGALATAAQMPLGTVSRSVGVTPGDLTIDALGIVEPQSPT
jgi:hypothetical protein